MVKLNFSIALKHKKLTIVTDDSPEGEGDLLSTLGGTMNCLFITSIIFQFYHLFISLTCKHILGLLIVWAFLQISNRVALYINQNCGILPISSLQTFLFDLMILCTRVVTTSFKHTLYYLCCFLLGLQISIVIVF